MDDMFRTMWIGALAGAIGGGAAVLVLAFLQPKRACPDCGEPVPKFRKPQTMKQMLWGGWTCPSCGCEVDRKGRKIQE